MNHLQWPKGQQLTVMEVTPLPEHLQGYGRYQVLLQPRDEVADPCVLWCQTAKADRPLQQGDIVVAHGGPVSADQQRVKGRTFSTVNVERLTQEEPDGAIYVLSIPLQP
jgi:hypothetical protein